MEGKKELLMEIEVRKGRTNAERIMQYVKCAKEAKDKKDTKEANANG